jgi:hypothetical protein
LRGGAPEAILRLVRRKRLVWLVAVGLAVGALVVLQRAPSSSPGPEAPAAARPTEPRKAALQADAEGYYVPGYQFTVNRLRFTGFRLRPEALVTFTETTGGAEQPLACLDVVIRADTVHLRCDDPQLGTVTVDGRFLTRLATNRLDTAVLAAVVTVRTGSGEILYRARDSFKWHPSDSTGAGT